MKRSAWVISIAAIAVSLVFVVLWQIFLSESTSFYMVSAIILALSMLPFLISMESEKIKSREIALMGVLIALAVVSRAVFYYIPQFKPIGAVVICSGVSLGARRGYVVGAFSAFISNFLFGQGMWTPFQMVALGLVGFLAGAIYKRLKPGRINLAIIGFVLAFVVYGGIVNISSVLTMATDYTLPSIVAIYAAGAPYDAIFGGTTALFLVLLGKFFIKRLNRIIIKYGIIERGIQDGSGTEEREQDS